MRHEHASASAPATRRPPGPAHKRAATEGGGATHLRYTSVPHTLAAAAARDATTGITLLADRADRPERHRSYRELWGDAHRVASRLEKLGVAPGDRVMLVFPTSFEFAAAFVGVQLLGAIPVPAYPPAGLRIEAGLERLAHIARHAEAGVILTSGLFRAACGDVALRAPCVRAVELVDASHHALAADDGAGLGPDRMHRIQTSDAAFIQFTSGSTGRPKGVLLTHANLLANMQASGEASHMTPDDVMVSWLPLYHDMGLIGALLYSIYWQIPLVLMSPLAFLRQPIRWLRALSEHRGTLSPAPNFAYGLCVKRVPIPEREGLDLASWRLAHNGGEPVNSHTVRDFEAAYAPYGFRAAAAFPVYGLAEASLAVTFPPVGALVRQDAVDRTRLGAGRAVAASPGDNAVTFVSVGVPVPRHEVQVVDAHGARCDERVVGEVLVRGPSVMQGYFRDPEATARVVQDGWLRTGDLAYVADGELFVVGRAKDLIIIRGRNVYPEDIERSAEAISGVRGGGSVAFGVYDEGAAEERVVLVCETKAADGAERTLVTERVRRLVQDAHDVTVQDVKLVAPGTIPKTSSGKRQRSRCRELYLHGALDAKRSSTLSHVLVAVRGAAGLAATRVRRLLRRD